MTRGPLGVTRPASGVCGSGPGTRWCRATSPGTRRTSSSSPTPGTASGPRSSASTTRPALGGEPDTSYSLATAKRGRVVAAFMAGLEDEILLISSSGVVIRTAVREIASQGRDATGVRVMNLDGGDAVAAVAPVAGEVSGDA